MSFEAEAKFCLKFLQIENNKKSLIYSPASLLNALALIYAGAGGKTAEEIAEIIGNSEILQFYILIYVLNCFIFRSNQVTDFEILLRIY